MFKRLDPRIRLLWWLCITILTMRALTIESNLVLVTLLAATWITTGLTEKLAIFTRNLVPFLILMAILSLFPTFQVEISIRMTIRYYILLASTALVLNSTSYGEMTNAFRSFKSKRLKFLEVPLEVFSFVFGLTMYIVPMTEEEWIRLCEVQRARGVDLTRGSRISRVKRGLEVLRPLMNRVFDRIKFLCIAVLAYGYNPFVSRSQYTKPPLAHLDRIASLLLLGITASWVGLSFIFTV